MLFAILKTKKLPTNCNLRNIHQQFGQRNTGEQHKGRQRSDSAEPYAISFHRSNFSQRKRPFTSGKRGFHPCFCLPACCNCPVALSEFATCFIKATNSELASFKKCNCSRKNRLQNQFASQMWATRPHLGSIFEKLLHRKTFQLPAARILQPLSINPNIPAIHPAEIVHLPDKMPVLLPAP